MGPDQAREREDPGIGGSRALSVLELLAGMEQPSRLTEITARTEMSKSNTYRALRWLQEAGFVDHLGRKGYRLGARSFALATLIRPRDAVTRTSKPILAWLVQISDATVAVALRSGDHRVLVADLHPPARPGEVLPVIGERTPLTSGCAGTAILAYLSESEASEIAARWPTRREGASATELAAIRKQGYAMSFGANHVGMNGIAAPLLSPATGAPLGSLSISGDTERLTERALHRLSEPLRRAASQLAPLMAKGLGPMSSEIWPPLDAVRL
jgi:DNA-binding IclR family transcriptional regulator